MVRTGPKGLKAAIAFVIFFAFIIFAFQPFNNKSVTNSSIKVLAYSSFLASWGPGPELAALFKKETGVEVVYQDADDAGLLLTKLELFPSDVVLGLDWITAFEARAKVKWVKHGIGQSAQFEDPEFVAFDWAPLTFIFREGEIDPPRSLDDLLDSRFKGKISLQDPRTSAPGLQFLFWLVSVKGEEGAFEFLKLLRPNIRAISPSWSTAYGLFQKGEAQLAFSYLTSPVYHWENDKDLRYQPALLENDHIYQVEMGGIPASSSNVPAAIKFLQFLRSPQAQKIIMKKNVMFPIDPVTKDGTDFAKLPETKLIELKKIEPHVEKKKELIQRWKDLKL